MKSSNRAMTRCMRRSFVSPLLIARAGSRWMWLRPGATEYWHAGISAALVLRARAAGPPGTMACRPKNRTSTPGPCSRSQRRATTWLARSASVIARMAERPSMITFIPNRCRVRKTASFSDPGNFSATAAIG